jgi:formate/nitrite transporter
MSGAELRSDRPLELHRIGAASTSPDRRVSLEATPSEAPDPGTTTDVCTPRATASRICRWSRAKRSLPFSRLVSLGTLGGIYIGLGAAFATLITSDSSLGAGPTRWLGGIAFSLGLLLVVIGGAELSTGNCLMAITRMQRQLASHDLWRNWSVAYGANALGAVLLAWVIVRSGTFDAEPLRSNAIRIAEAKLALPPAQAFLRGVLANMLVCLAVWLAMSSHTVVGKFIGIVFPISAFVALGFEHSIANLYLIPAGLMAGAKGGVGDVLANIVPVTAGNLVGGAVVAAGLLYWSHAQDRDVEGR